MKMRDCILITLTDSGPASFVDLIGVTCEAAEDFNVNILASVLYQLVRECKVIVDSGIYSMDTE